MYLYIMVKGCEFKNNMTYIPKSTLMSKAELNNNDVFLPYFKSTNDELLRKKKLLIDKLINELQTFTVHGVHIDSCIKKEINSLSVDIVKKMAANKNIIIGITKLQTYDKSTYHHSLSVTILSLAIGSALNLQRSKLIELGIAAMLHDIGKINIPHNIIAKPSKLTEAEFEIIKDHPLNGGNHLISNLAITDNMYKGIISHHEKYNGTGYPKGLKGEEIPLFGRIITIADVYDALTGNRPYRKPISPSEAIEYIMEGSSIIFDSKVVKAFLTKIVPYPIGMIVKLNNDKQAYVVKENPLNPLRPTVKLLDKSKKELDLFTDLKLADVAITGTHHSALIVKN